MIQPVPAYSRTAISLHWLIAVLIFSGFALGLIMTDIPGLTPTKLRYYSWHKWIGVTVWMLALIRLLWRLTHPPPPFPPTMPAWQRRAAQGAHALLYLLMLAVPVSGYLYSLAAGVPVVYLGLIPLPILIAPDPALKESFKIVHLALNYTMAALVGLHVLAALRHQFIDRDHGLMRILRAGAR